MGWTLLVPDVRNSALWGKKKFTFSCRRSDQIGLLQVGTSVTSLAFPLRTSTRLYSYRGNLTLWLPLMSTDTFLNTSVMSITYLNKLSIQILSTRKADWWYHRSRRQIDDRSKFWYMKFYLCVAQCKEQCMDLSAKWNNIFLLMLYIQLSLKKGNWDSILNLSKSKRQIIKLLSVDDSILFFFYMVHWSFILGQGWLLSNNFCKHVKTVFIQVLSWYTKQCGCINCCFVVKAPANAIMQHKQLQLGQNQFWHVLQNWLLCSHPWPNMNEQCTKSK